MRKKSSLILIASMLLSSSLYAQSMVDFSIGTSRQDAGFANLAYRIQVSNKFRIGLEAQLGSVSYRFIDGKRINKGNVSTFGIPLTLRVYEKDKIRLDFYNKIGLRLLATDEKSFGSIDDATRSSTAIMFEPGLLVTVKLNESLNFQSGFTVPTVYQVSSEAALENVFPLLTHLSINKKVGSNKILFVKTAFGAATGGNGDTQKHFQSVQFGLRINLGKKTNLSFVEPSF